MSQYALYVTILNTTLNYLTAKWNYLKIRSERCGISKQPVEVLIIREMQRHICDFRRGDERSPQQTMEGRF